MKNWFQNIRLWAEKWANTKWGVWSIFLCAFADASFLPLPTPMFFITLVLINKEKAFKFAFFGSIGALLGAMVGYAIGYFAWLNSAGEFSVFAQFVFKYVPGFSESVYNSIQNLFIKWDVWILFIASFSPLPFKLFSISSGVFNVNLFMFSLSTLIGQTAKFYILAYLTVKIGHDVKKIIQFNSKPILVIAVLCFVIGFFTYKYL
jgi:membrane protein YqaA with SNARE-associated domain